MTYSLVFNESALKEWDKLGATVRKQFKNKLESIVENPRVEANRLSGQPDRYKIKLRSAGYRLVYQVYDDRIVVKVVAVGKREKNKVYKIAARRV